MKRFLVVIVTLLFLLGTTYAVAHYAEATFVDYAFFVGIVYSIIIRFFTSKGGFLTNAANLNSSTQLFGTNVQKLADDHTSVYMKAQPSLAFITAVSYTTIALIT